MNIFKKNGFYVMALVLVAGILAVSGIAGYVSGQKERINELLSLDVSESYKIETVREGFKPGR